MGFEYCFKFGMLGEGVGGCEFDLMNRAGLVVVSLSN